MSSSAAVRAVAIKCPRCKSSESRRSRRRKDDGWLTRAMIYLPYRCEACGQRFFNLSRRFASIAGRSAVASVVVGALCFTVYLLDMDITALVKRSAKPALAAVASKPASTGSARSDIVTPELITRAEAGDPRSQYQLGMFYKTGGAASKNYAEALKWLERAANGGEVNARYTLGLMYKNGTGALQNFELAFKWFELAASQNHAQAQYNVALMHKNGIGVPVNIVKAYMWANLASAQGLSGAETLRDTLMVTMSTQQVAEGQRASSDWKPIEPQAQGASAAAATGKT